ncbi:MAG: hypothetical protein C0594_15040, partial [Marinilabiliales bacterium]
MNKTQFIEYLEEPDLLNDEANKELMELLEEFPYFQTARMLLVKGLHNSGNIKYENQLKLAAAHITDRSKLFSLINFKPDSETLKQREVLAVEKSKLEEEAKRAEELKQQKLEQEQIAKLEEEKKKQQEEAKRAEELKQQKLEQERIAKLEEEKKKQQEEDK